jgi:hypothetical protein
LLLFSLVLTVNCYSQKFSVGLLNGVNRSNLSGNQTSEMWKVKPGPITGLWFNYAPNGIFSLQTEISRMTIYYEQKTYYYPMYWLYSDFALPSIDIPYYNASNAFSFSFYRVPIQVRFSTPTRVKFNLSAGVYFSYRYDYSQMVFYYQNKPPKYDFGYIYSAGFSYSVNNDLKVFVDGRYTTGRKIFIDRNNGRNGTSEMIFGIGYSGFGKKISQPKVAVSPDSSIRNVFMINYLGGFSGSMNGGQHNSNSYNHKGGLVAGVTFDYFLSPDFAISSGFIFEQKGYHFKDTSQTRFIYNPSQDPAYTTFNDCKFGMDYIVIPVTIKLKFGNNLKYYFNTGFYTGLRLNARVTGKSWLEQRSQYGYSLTEYTVSDDIDGNIKDDDWGWIFGGGVIIPINNNYSIDFGFTYNTGWRDILDINPQQLRPGADKSIKNKSLNFTVGLQIPLF